MRNLPSFLMIFGLILMIAGLLVPTGTLSAMLLMSGLVPFALGWARTRRAKPGQSNQDPSKK